jgi:hypothetical protein
MLEPSPPGRYRNGLGAVARSDLRPEAGGAAADRDYGDRQTARDGTIGVAVADQLDDVELVGGERAAAEVVRTPATVLDCRLRRVR